MKTKLTRNLEDYFLFLISSFVNLFLIFNFQGLADFRDFKFIPFPIFDRGLLEFSFYRNSVLHLVSFNDYSIILFWSIFFSLVFGLGIFLNYSYGLRILKSIFHKNFNLDEKYLKISILILSLLLIYNPFIMERFLMGHVNFIIGHLIFIPCLSYLLDFFLRYYQEGDRKFLNKYFIALLVAAFILFLTSIHHFAFYLFLILQFNFILLIKYLVSKKTVLDNTKNNSNNLKSFLEFSKSSLILIISGLVLFLIRYVSTVRFYLESISRSDQKDLIIQNFSLQPRGSNLSEKLIQVASGLGSWMNPFFELNKLKLELGMLSDFTLYYSFILQFLFVLLLIYLFIKFISFKFDKSLIWLKYFLLFNLVFSFILNFGYSLNFKILNQFFYIFPGSYIFREAGKFYGFFLIFIFLTSLLIFRQASLQRVNLGTEKIKNRFRKVFAKVQIISLFLLFISSVIPFLFLSSNLNYVQYPEIFNRINQSCTQDQRFFFLPDDIYLVPSYSPEVFIVNPRYNLITSCDTLETGGSRLQNFTSSEKVYLNQTIESQKIQDILVNLNSNQISNQEFINQLKEFLESNQTTDIVIDTNPNKNLELVNQILLNSNKFKQVASEGTLYWHELVE
jgi:hypothetical protein